MARKAALVLIMSIAASRAPALAVDLAVSYLADGKAAGSLATETPLTIEVFADAGCASPLLAQAVVAGSTVIERVRTLRLRGAPKAPRAVRLHHVLTDVPAATSYFARVTGAGITPVGGACQAQGGGQPPPALPCASQVGTDVFFSGCNVHVRSGTGATIAANGLGNLIVGYNEPPTTPEVPRVGSHNVIVGERHAYDTYASLIVGYENTAVGALLTVIGTQNRADPAANSSILGGQRNVVEGFDAMVVGGGDNYAGGPGAIVLGGTRNHAEGVAATVSGGFLNQASGLHSTVSGGKLNHAGGEGATVLGGFLNQAMGTGDVVSGGRGNTTFGDYASISAGTNNFAVGDGSSVSGGHCNSAGTEVTVCSEATEVGTGASVSGGTSNRATQLSASITGGYANLASAPYAAVCGGAGNGASGYASAIGGGEQRTVSGHYDWRAGSLLEDF